jgi:hypothetical protein
VSLQELAQQHKVRLPEPIRSSKLASRNIVALNPMPRSRRTSGKRMVVGHVAVRAQQIKCETARLIPNMLKYCTMMFYMYAAADGCQVSKGALQFVSSNRASIARTEGIAVGIGVRYARGRRAEGKAC